MIKPNKYFDIVLLAIFGVVLLLSIYQHFAVGLIIYINNILALIALIIGVSLIVKKTERSRYVLLVLILLATGGIINFLGGIARIGGFAINDDVYLQYPGIDPIMLLILLIYFIVNRHFIIETYIRFKSGSEEEQANEFEKKASFYYDKFNGYSAEEFDKLYTNFEAYPPEAQAAFTKIIAERINTQNA